MDQLAKRVAARYRGLFASDDDPKQSEDEKSGEWNLLISKYSPTRWRYTLKNPKGGSGGSGAYSTPKAAIAAAIGRGVSDTMGKEKVWVIEQVWNAGKGDDGGYETKKTYWLDLKKGEAKKG